MVHIKEAYLKDLNEVLDDPNGYAVIGVVFKAIELGSQDSQEYVRLSPPMSIYQGYFN